jgi:hypothetical protein
VFLFVIPVGETFEATPFDIENLLWSHRGERCTFDVMVEEFGLATPPLLRLATMVRGADTARLDRCPMAAYGDPGTLSPLVAGTLGGLLATWVTFTRCFLWIFVGGSSRPCAVTRSLRAR